MATATHLIICTFDGEQRADQAARAIRALDTRLDTVKLGDLAVVRKDTSGAISFWDSDELSGVQRNQTFGMVLGWLLGAVGTVLGGPLGPGVGLNTGNELGRQAGFAGDFGFPDEQLNQVAEHLDAGSSALILLVRPHDIQVVEEELERLGGTLIQHSLAPELIEKLGGE